MFLVLLTCTIKLRLSGKMAHLVLLGVASVLYIYGNKKGWRRVPSVCPVDHHPECLSQHCKQSTGVEIYFWKPANNKFKKHPYINNKKQFIHVQKIWEMKKIIQSSNIIEMKKNTIANVVSIINSSVPYKIMLINCAPPTNAEEIKPFPFQTSCFSWTEV
jgi:hypothetical protein